MSVFDEFSALLDCPKSVFVTYVEGYGQYDEQIASWQGFQGRRNRLLRKCKNIELWELEGVQDEDFLLRNGEIYLGVTHLYGATRVKAILEILTRVLSRVL